MPARRPGHLDDLPSRSLTRRRLLVGGAAAGGVLALGGLPVLGQEAPEPTGPDGSSTAVSGGPVGRGTAVATPIHPEDPAPRAARAGFDTSLTESPDRGIMFPVYPNSKASWTDTYGACRDGCSRKHQGQDLMAPKKTPLLAVVDGVIAEFRHRSSGNSLYIKGDDGWFYCYLHINNDRPGTDDGSNLAEHAWAPALRKYAGNEAAARGHRVRRGEHVAYVGDSGNAEGSGSHLHFEIRKPASSLWDAPSVNPRVSLQKAEAARMGPSVSPDTFTPWTASAPLVDRQYRDFVGRAPDASAGAYWRSQLDGGTRTPHWFMQYMVESDECDAKTQAVARLYEAFFLRRPDYPGFEFWTARRRGGQALTSIADGFSRSEEFGARYGTLSNGDFVDRVYRNVLGRPPDQEGHDFWTAKLDGGRSRGTVMVQFSDSPENRAKQKWKMHVIATYGCMLKRIPPADELTLWAELLSSGQNSTQDMVNMIRMGDEYKQVVTGA